MSYDYDFHSMREEAKEPKASNETFRRVAMILGGLVGLTTLCAVLYALVIGPMQREGRAQGTQGAVDELTQSQRLTQTAMAEFVTPAPSPTPIFSDVSPEHWAQAYITETFRRGYVSGCSDDPPQFCPDAPMTRAEIAVLIVRGLYGAAYEPAPPTSTIFEDVALDYWGAKWIHKLYVDRHTQGCSQDPLLYCPEEQPTRAEGVVFFLRMLRGVGSDPPEPTEQIFGDVPSGLWYSRWVHAGNDVGLVLPCETEPVLNFCPEEPLTRAMAAFMMTEAKGWQIP